MKKLIIIIAVLGISACFSVNPNLTPEGSKVKIVKAKPTGCEELGPFKSPSIDVDTVGEKKTMNIIRNIVADEGGDTARLKDMATYGVYKSKKYYTFEGYMYKCR
jgi:hypothetical protein